MHLTGHFINSNAGHIYMTQWGNLAAPVGVLCLPPLFEELNMSRAVLGKLAWHMAARGVPVCMPDYLGTGDSEGEFEQMDASNWLENILIAGQWMHQQGTEQLILLGVRFGALLQLQHQQSLHERLNIKAQIVLKPVVSGKSLVTQLMRLKHTNHILAGGDKIDWREQVRNGQPIEVAGYPVSEGLLSSLEQLQVQTDPVPATPLTWLELGSKLLAPTLAKFQQAWPDTVIQAVASSTFWQTPEIYQEPALYPIHDEILKRYV